MKIPKLMVFSGIAIFVAISVNLAFKEDIKSSLGLTDQVAFEQNPPIPVAFTIQKLPKPTPIGENLIFRVQYESDGPLPEQITTFQNGRPNLILKDDGVFPDNVKGDKKYATLKSENIPSLLMEIVGKEKILDAQDKVITFVGHVGEVVQDASPIRFNLPGFLSFQEVSLSPLFLTAAECTPTIFSEKSLLITDLSVVEDPSRTYNVKTGAGTSNGVWTFGTLMANINNNTHSNGLRGFLKAWVKTWVTDQTVNGKLVAARGGTREDGEFVFLRFIGPWLQKARNNTSLVVDISNWESLWDATDENLLRINAPFKLTAIVNRIDLRGNSAYNANLSNAGETRFIYTLIDPFTGQVPENPNQTASAGNGNGPGFFDWKGLNIIFEYGNIQTNACDLQSFAQQWYNLSSSSITLGSPAYNTALAQITNTVTAAGSKTGKPNNSAINRIRTSEKVFAPFDVDIEGHAAWEKQDWEFRQYELNSTHNLVNVPLTNNPPFSSNYAPNIAEDYSNSNPAPSITNHQIIDWIYSGNRAKVRNGNFNLPNNLLASADVIRREATQYFDFDRSYWITKSPNYPLADIETPNTEAKKIRQQLSLNTCTGCHAGETKTRFTHVNPLSYGESSNYWDIVPSGASGIQDDNLYPNGGNDPLKKGGKNKGQTEGVYNYDAVRDALNQRYFQAVSAFLTGRQYQVLGIGGSGFTDDDDLDQEDHTVNGNFYVNDPSNDSDNLFPYGDNKRWGYNDLLRRKMDLCLFLTTSCTSTATSSSVQLMGHISKVPLPLGSH